jgi:ABC-type phosphate transport system substrate-binding protein
VLGSVLIAASAAAGSAFAQPAAARLPAALPAHAALIVIVNRENPENEISIADLRRMLLGDTTRWADGRKVTIALREPRQPERDAVLRLVCRMSDDDFSRYLLHAAYRGELHAGPKILDTANGVRRFVFNVPGAIGFIRADELDASIKPIRIVGAPSETAFGLALAK